MSTKLVYRKIASALITLSDSLPLSPQNRPSRGNTAENFRNRITIDNQVKYQNKKLVLEIVDNCRNSANEDRMYEFEAALADMYSYKVGFSSPV